jgi:hypothetical protein
MATPADQRLLELLDKWLKSLELHTKYASLDDDSYTQIQPWPEHQRPSRWIIDLAMQKATALKAQVQERIKMGDAAFSDSLELMTFLANLVGSQHIERFIPLAEAGTEQVLQPASPADRWQDPPAGAITATREMPRFLLGTQHAPAPTGTAQVARTERKASDAKAAPTPIPTSKPAAKQPVKQATSGKPPPTLKPSGPARPASSSPGKPAAKATAPASAISEVAREQVIADAARLVQWGRKWYELAELIARMADRPSLTEVRRILKDNKTVIDKKAGRG